MSAAGSVTVPAWGELHGERKVPGVLRVLIAGQSVGAIQRTRDGWEAQARGLRPSRPATHASAGDALQAIILRSSWARKLSARTASGVYWSGRATQLAAKTYRKAER